MSSVNGAVPTTIIVAGLALAGYALLMTALNRRMSVPLLAALDVLEILLLVEVSLIVAKLASGQHPAGLATLIGYLIAMPLIPVAAAFWGLVERSRWDPAGHRRGRTRRGHTDGPAAPNLAGHPCLSPRHRLSPQHPLSRRRRARPGQDPAVCWSPPTDFALSASARAGVQITTKFGHAPVAYLLSAFAAVVYILAVGLRSRGLHPRHGHPHCRQPRSTPDRRPVLLDRTRRRAGGRYLEPGRPGHLPRRHGVVQLWQRLRLRPARPFPVFGLLWLRRWTGRARTRPTIVTSAGDAGEAAGGGVDHGEGGGPGQGAEDVVADGRT
jgi:hypothetical protein